MKKTIVLVIVMFMFSFQFVKPQEVDDIRIKFTERVPITIQALPSSNAIKDYVKIMTVGLEEANSPSSMSMIKSRANAIFDMDLSVANISNMDAVIKVEFEMRYNDGASRYYRKKTFTISSGTAVLYSLNVTNKTKTDGWYTLIGRISGAGIGNDNVVITRELLY